MAHCTSNLREIRTQLGLSQADCATALSVALETFRAWDAGRRPAPDAIVNAASALKPKRPLHDRVPLQVLADELHVHVRTLRAAAHDGRLAGNGARIARHGDEDPTPGHGLDLQPRHSGDDLH